MRGRSGRSATPLRISVACTMSYDSAIHTMATVGGGGIPSCPGPTVRMGRVERNWTKSVGRVFFLGRGFC